jgi:parallel beta-helix repeat protein
MGINGSTLSTTSDHESPVMIIGNSFFECADNAIDAGGGYGWHISENYIWGVNMNNAVPAGEGYGITNCGRAVITNNKISWCWRSGISLYNNNNCLVSGNSIENCNLGQFAGSPPTMADAGIYVWSNGAGSTCSYNTVKNNQIIDNQATAAKTLTAIGAQSVAYTGSMDFKPNQCVKIDDDDSAAEYNWVDYVTYSDPTTTVYLVNAIAGTYTTGQNAFIQGVATQIAGVQEYEASSGDTDYNIIKDNMTSGISGWPVVQLGAHSTFDRRETSAVLDLSGSAIDVPVFHVTCASQIAGYTIVYTEASSADAGVSIRIGRYQDGVALDDDYFDITTSEVSKNLGYSLFVGTSALTKRILAAGDTITVGTAGGKTGTGEVRVVLHISEQGNTSATD